MLCGGRGWSPRSRSSCENAPVGFTPTYAGLWSALLPGQAWRLSGRGTASVMQHSHGDANVLGRIMQCHARSQSDAPSAREATVSEAQAVSLDAGGSFSRVKDRRTQPRRLSSIAITNGRVDLPQQEGYRSEDAEGEEGGSPHLRDQRHDTGRAQSAELQIRGSDFAAEEGNRHDYRGNGSFRARSAWIGTDRSRRARRGRSTSTSRPLPAELSDERVVPLMRKAERDLLPGGDPNTPWRRLTYQLRLAPSISDLQALYRSNRENTSVWRPHMTALIITRTGALLYPKAVAAAAPTVQGEGRTDGSGRFPPPYLKREATSLFESLSGKINKLAVRQVQGMHLARLLVSMAWLEIAGEKCEVLKAALIGELQRQRGGKLAQVALVDPPLFGRLVRALAQLAARNSELWMDLQRITLAALLEAQAEASSVEGTSSRCRVWAGPGRDGAVAMSAAESALPPKLKPDCSAVDLANMAFGFAAAGAATPQLFGALRAAVLFRELPADATTLARLLCAWGRAHIPPGKLLYRLIETFIPLLDMAPPRPIGRMLWSLAMMGVRDERFLRTAAKAIVERRLVFSSPQELVNVVWAYSHLGWQVEEGSGPLRPVTSTTGGAGNGLASLRPGGVMRQPPGELAEGAVPVVFGSASSESQRQQREILGEAGEDEASVAALRPEAHAREPGHELHGHTQEVSSSTGVLGTQNRNGDNDGIMVGPKSDTGEAGVAWGHGPGNSAASLPQLKPLPLAAPLSARDQARHALQHQPPPDYPEHYALYRYLGRSFIHRMISNSGTVAHHSISHSQLAVMVGSFARAGYRSKQLFYTTARIALLRLQFLSPADLTLILSAHARLRIAHTGLFEATCPIIAARCCEFTAAQLADVMWAVQVLHPESYVQLSNAIRMRRGWLPPPPAVQRSSNVQHSFDGLGEGSDEEDSEAEEERDGKGESSMGRKGMAQQQRRSGVRGSDNITAQDVALLPLLMRLRVPRELLEDVDWIEAQESAEQEERLESEFRDRDGSMWDTRQMPIDDGGYWEGGQASSTFSHARE